MEQSRNENSKAVTDTVKTVAISGGTHGNELIGVYLVREWMKRPELVQRSSFKTQLLITNPRAVEKCVRYIDVDLNRQFTPANLQAPEKDSNSAYEVKRAREVETKFGDCSVDFWVDLHNTTANMGVCLMLPNKNDPLALTVAAALQLKFGDCIRLVVLPRPYNYKISEGNRSRSGSVADTGRHGFGLEVGPLAHGTLNASLYNYTKSVVHHILDVLDKMNRGWRPDRDVIEVYEPFRKVDYPRDDVGEISAMLHPSIDGKDWAALNPGDPLFLTFDGEDLPYDGQEEAHSMFINEASYMEKGTALVLTRKLRISISGIDLQSVETVEPQPRIFS